MLTMNKVLQVFWKGLTSFGRFWKDFLIGDTPEIALGVLVILGLAFLLHKSVVAAGISTIFLVILLVTASVWRRAH